MGLNSNRVEDFACHETTIRMPTEAMQPVEIHKVCLPPKQTTFQKLKHRLSEIFFPDDPLHRFKNQTWLRKVILGLQFFFPIFQWGPEYNVSLLRSDVISGLTIASLAIPQVRHVFQFSSCHPCLSLSFSFPPKQTHKTASDPRLSFSFTVVWFSGQSWAVHIFRFCWLIWMVVLAFSFISEQLLWNNYIKEISKIVLSCIVNIILKTIWEFYMNFVFNLHVNVIVDIFRLIWIIYGVKFPPPFFLNWNFFCLHCRESVMQSLQICLL